MVSPPVWSSAELDGHCAAARDLFRKARTEEPATVYAGVYAEAYDAVDELLERTADLTKLVAAMPEICKQEQLLRALRYLAGPPISHDDLKTVADVDLTVSYLEAHPEAYDAIAGAVLTILDRHRFPWVAEHREATDHERDVAVVATATAIASQRLQTIRRNKARAMEMRVADVLVAAGFKKVDKREVRTASDWPKPGEFCGEQKVAGRQADLIATLFDGRYMPIECKSSGSSVNSIKRLNNDALAKFSDWTRDFGVAQTLPVAVLEGVYKLDRVLAAQKAGATIFWGHQLDPLSEFVAATRT